jgi:hypothetical protein
MPKTPCTRGCTAVTDSGNLCECHFIAALDSILNGMEKKSEKKSASRKKRSLKRSNFTPVEQDLASEPKKAKLELSCGYFVYTKDHFKLHSEEKPTEEQMIYVKSFEPASLGEYTNFYHADFTAYINQKLAANDMTGFTVCK